jgi:hypothetical protein
MTETQREAQTRKKLGLRAPICRCKPVNPKHKDSYQCVSPAELEAWRARHPDSLASLRTQKILASWEIEFGRGVITLAECDHLHRITGT